jgi:hypothetical protein
MMSISRFFLVTAGLLAFSVAGATAQQNNPAGEGGSAMKSTGPSGQSGAMKSSMAGDAMKSTNNGYEKKQPVSGTGGGAQGNHASTGPSAKQPQ